MKLVITSIVLLLGSSAVAQCKVCYSLEEAKKSPEQVEELHLTNSPMVLIDTTFNQFTSLRVLNLSYNPIMEVTANTSIPSLKELNLSHASYNPWKIGAIGAAFPNLEQLDLSSNQLSFIWSGLQSLHQLIRLDVSDNHLIDIPVEMSYLSNLKELDLSKNEIKLQANELGALWSLEKLDISENSGLSTNNLILSIAESKHLKDLSLDGDELTPGSIQMLSQMRLERLELADISKPSQIDFTRFSNIKTLALRHSPNWLSPQNARQFNSITQIELTNSGVPAGLDKLKSLSVLIVSTANDWQITELYPLKKLRVLDISNSNFKDDQIARLRAELPNTQIITGTSDVSENMISNKVQPIIEIPAKAFVIPSNAATTLTEKNVTLAIPENAFLDSAGNTYTGKVNISLTVYDDPIQTALAGIPMTFVQNSKQEIFASNGMLRFEAKGENNELLKPDPANLIQASIGNLQPQNPGGLYAFDPQTAQWNTISDTVNSTNSNASLQDAIDSINRLDLKHLIPRTYNDRIFAIYPKFSRFDRTQLSLYSEFVPASSASVVVTHNRTNALGKLMTKQTWVVDTIVSKEMKQQLKVMKRETKGWYAKRSKKKGWSMKFIPRLMNQLSIEPDPMHDNYRLHFMYRDSAVSLPVALAGTTNQKIQRKTQKFQSSIKYALASDQKEEKNYWKTLDEQLELAEKTIRQKLITEEIARINQLRFGINQQPAPNRLNFGLSIFGLINCDFFQRQRPDFNVTASQKLKDQDGKLHKVPESVISIDPKMNFYTETQASSKIRCFRSTILVFDFGDKKIGVSKPQKRDGTVSEIILIDITDKTPAEISQTILSI
nr:leucine-rich repeat domain-containing protein [uncultured Fluviicola sp.]